ncbi:MAG: MFS transporter [Halobaculum sp.]
MVVPSPLRDNPTFCRVWLVGLCFRVATGFRRIAIPWFVLDRTGSPLQLGVALAVGSLDALAAPLLGPLTDRIAERRVVAGGLVVYGLTLLSLPVAATAGRLPLWAVYLALFLLGVAQFAYHNARHTWVPRLVEALDDANALIHGTGAATRVVFLLAGGVAARRARGRRRDRRDGDPSAGGNRRQRRRRLGTR